MSKPKTVVELREAGYEPKPVKQEIRDNLIRKLQTGELLFPGIIGFEDTVIPQIENAVLSRTGPCSRVKESGGWASMSAPGM